MKNKFRVLIFLFGIYTFVAGAWCDNVTPAPVQEKRVSDKNPQELTQDIRLRESEGSVAPIEMKFLTEKAGHEAIPIMEEGYQKASDALKQPGLDENKVTGLKIEKVAFASNLILLKDKDPQYRQYLVSLVEPLIDSDMPDPNVYGPDGKFKRFTYSQEFLKWCSERGLDWKKELQWGYQEGPLNLISLAMTLDAENVPLLLKGLQSPNPEVAMISAQGLASLNYQASIQLIIARCRREPVAERQGFAEYLLTFNDPAAFAAGQELMPDKKVLDYLLKMDIDQRRKSLLFE